MEVFLIRALQLILCLSLLVLLHEGGHFLFAKLFKVRVNKFTLFFDPWFTPVKFTPKGSDTTYCIGWLPLGGYVQIAGMVDETQKASQLSEKVEPWEFRAKPAWQRLLIMTGGVLMNLLTAFVIYAMVLFTWGDEYVPVGNMTHGFYFNAQATSLGFRNGDIPIKADVEPIERFDLDTYRTLSEAQAVSVLRDGKEVVVKMPEGGVDMLQMVKADPPFIAPLVPNVVDSVMAGSAAAKAGIQPGDTVKAFNGTAMDTWNKFGEIRGQMDDVLSAGHATDSARLRTVTIAVAHQGGTTTDTLTLHLGKDYVLGVMWNSPIKNYKTVRRDYGLLECFPAGVQYGWNVLSGYVNDLKYLFTADGAKSVGSFGAIGSLFPETWQWQRFWEMTAFISLMLAFMNILPIPALDGGHVLFLLVEIITRRKPSDKFIERAETVGMALILLLMALAIFNDFRNFVF
ncbi:MAG: RIP metalloprotease RseP [Bacteroidaceae bacterium]|nr:RIP metalloprotease RseP [Bacteroidaceae bacterium]